MVSVEGAPAVVAELVDQIQGDMVAAATEFRDANTGIREGAAGTLAIIR